MTEIEQARELALRFIDFQPRTCAEVRRRLGRAGYEAEIVEEVVADLERAGLLDDAQFSADWVESRGRRKGFGRVRLAAELRQKGISREETDAALERIDPEAELEAAIRLARKWLGIPESDLSDESDQSDRPDPATRRRLAAYLQRRGFGWDIVEQVFARIFTK